MNGRDFLLLAGSTTEAEWRSAVSRAYYACFHVARRLLSDLGFAVPRADRAHQYMIFRLSNSGEFPLEQAGRDLETLPRLRNRADYDETPAVPQPQAAAGVQLAEHIIQALDAARLDPVRTQITDTMKIYERDVLHDVTWSP